MGVVRRFAVAGLDEAARRRGQRRGLRIGAIDETSQVKQGCATAGVQRQYLGCVGKVANGITTVHLAYARERTGHALIGARQWIPREQIEDPVTSLVTGLPLDLAFRTKGELAIDICAEAFADGVTLDYVCGDEVYGNCTKLRSFLEERGQGYVLRVPSSFHLTLARGTRMTCAEAARRLPRHKNRWRSGPPGWLRAPAGTPGPWLPPPPRAHAAVRRHLGTGELAFHYCYLPEPVNHHDPADPPAGLRWPVEETFEFGKDCFGPGQSQVRLHAAIARHTVLVMAALAICAITAALLRDRTDTQAPPPVRPDQPPPPDPGTIPLTVPEIKHLLTAALTRPSPPGHADHWLTWRRRHQARARWYHQRARLTRDTSISLVS
jgi:hypothetical protein